MSSASVPATGDCVTVAASSPGGMARQFRVQFQSLATNDWQCHGTYRNREQAEAAMALLDKEGQKVRLICYNACPASM